MTDAVVVIPRGVVGVVPTVRKPMLVGAVLVLVLATVLTALVAARARGADLTRCERFTHGSHARAGVVTGHGQRILVIGDSWSAGLGLQRAAGSWPSRLDGRTRVAGFSGSGFSEGASDCGRVSFADRAPRALQRMHGAVDLVVVEGGLNDYDQSSRSIEVGFARLMRDLRGQHVVVVGPATAPSRARAVPRVDALLARLAAAYDAPYVATSALHLPYLPDRLHLTPAGHREFGDYVAERLAELAGS